jgi:predicted NBD/HSP70 family sugar kinase
MKTTGDQQLVKRINRSVLLRMLRIQPNQSRAELAVSTGLTKSTVSLLVRELIEDGWLTEVDVAGENEPASLRGLGRPSIPLCINGKSRGLIGVEIAIEALRVVVLSLNGKVLWDAEEILLSQTPASVCDQTAKLVARAHAHMRAQNIHTSGLGIGVPGVFQEATGRVEIAPNLGWRNVDFMPLIIKSLAHAGLPKMPVYVRNEADTASLSEYEFPGSDEIHSLIFVNCATGVGAGIVINDRLYSGMHGMAGEIGHSILQPDGLRCSCGRRGCVETLLGARALAAFDDPARGGQYLGLVLHNLWITFNPELIVVGGYSCHKYPEIVRVAEETLAAYAHSAHMPAPKIRVARYGMLAAAVGAAALTMHQYLRPMYAPSNADVNAEIPHLRLMDESA